MAKFTFITSQDDLNHPDNLQHRTLHITSLGDYMFRSDKFLKVNIKTGKIERIFLPVCCSMKCNLDTEDYHYIKIIDIEDMNKVQNLKLDTPVDKGYLEDKLNLVLCA